MIGEGPVVSGHDRDNIRTDLIDLSADGPLVIVVLASYRPDPQHLRTAVQSLVEQIMGNPEIPIVDDASIGKEYTRNCPQQKTGFVVRDNLYLELLGQLLPHSNTATSPSAVAPPSAWHSSKPSDNGIELSIRNMHWFPCRIFAHFLRRGINATPYWIKGLSRSSWQWMAEPVSPRKSGG